MRDSCGRGAKQARHLAGVAALQPRVAWPDEGLHAAAAIAVEAEVDLQGALRDRYRVTGAPQGGASVLVSQLLRHVHEAGPVATQGGFDARCGAALGCNTASPSMSACAGESSGSALSSSWEGTVRYGVRQQPLLMTFR